MNSAFTSIRSVSSRKGLPSLGFALLFILTVVFQNPAETSAADNGSKNDLLSMSVEELMEVEIATVVGASRFEQQVTEAPASVSIVSADDIKKHGYRTLADALRSVRGIYVTYDRNYNYLGMRGFNRPGDLNTRTLLLVDGHRINDNIYESAPIGTEFPVDVDLIERIEVIRGPSSSLYGTNAFFGVINVITKRPGELQGTQLAAAAGSFETYNGRVSYGKEYAAGLGVLLSGSVLHSEGQDRLFYKEFETAGNDGVARHADGDKNYQLFSKLSYRDFSLTGVLSSRRKGIPTASYETVFNDPGTNTTDQYRFLDLKYAHTFAGDTDVSVRAFYDHYSFDGNYMYDHTDTGGPASVLNRDQAWGSWWGTEAQVTKTVSDWLKTTAGVEYRNNSKQQQRNYDQAPFFSYLDDKRHSSLWALYLQSEIRLLDSLILSAGVRHDQYDSFGGTTNPRVALIYKPLERSVFKLLYGRAFRAPSAFEFYYSDGGQTTKADQDLKPESIQTYEAVYEQYFLKHYRSSLSGFYYRIQDLISQQVDPADGLIQFVNAQNPIEAKGGELELEGTWDGGLRGRVSYTYQQVRDARTGVALSNSPRHLAKLNLVLPIMRDRLFLGAEEQYTSSRSTLAGNQTGDAYLTNATLSCRTPLQGLELILSVYNLFDRHYGDPGGAEHLQDVIRQDGRSFRVKLDYRF